MVLQNLYRQSPPYSFFRIIILVSVLFMSMMPSPVHCADDEETVYSIQLGSYPDRNEAEEKIDSLMALGHDAFLITSDNEDNGKVSVVCIERFNTEKEAEDEAVILKELNLISEYSIRAIKDPPSPVSESLPGMSQKEMEDGFYLQISASREEKNAGDEVNKIMETGRKAFYRHETVKDKGSWYRVYVGRYPSKAEALEDAREMKKSGIVSAWYLRQIGRTSGPPALPAPGKEDEADEKSYYLHVSSHMEKVNAEKDVSRLKRLGLKAFFRQEEISGVSWYRTFIGEFGDEAAARRIGSELRDRGEIFYFKPVEIDKSILE